MDSSNNTETLRFNVAGISFHVKKGDGLFCLKFLKPNGYVSFLKEPTNEVDKNAVRVIYEGYHIGYVPASLNKNWNYKTGKVVSYSYIDDEDVFNNDDRGVLGSVTIEVDNFEKVKKDTDTVEVLHFGDKEILYDRINHIYSDESGQILSASRLKKLLPVDSEEIERLLKWAFDNFDTYEECQNNYKKRANDGNNIHKICEKAIRGKKVDKKFRQHPIFKFISKYSPKLIQTEEVVFDESVRLIGRYDALVVINGKRILIDWKSGKMNKKHWEQLAFYAYMLNADEMWVVSFTTKSQQGYSVSKIKRSGIELYYKISKNLTKNYYLLEQLKNIKKCQKNNKK